MRCFSKDFFIYLEKRVGIRKCQICGDEHPVISWEASSSSGRSPEFGSVDFDCQIECRHCGTTGPQSSRSTFGWLDCVEEAVAAWNGHGVYG